jgi:tRNA (adenine22-N1)-methyltransferase
MRLDARLQAVLDEVSCHTLADIGCDHGKLAVSALLAGKAQKVIAVDISASSLQKCRRLGEQYQVSSSLDCRQGDGFLPLSEDEADLAVIAGMGGREIVRILGSKPFSGRLLLVPHQDAEILRSFLSGRYIVKKDFVVNVSGVYYFILCAQRGSGFVYEPQELYFGLNVPQTEAWQKMVKEKRDCFAALIEKNRLATGDIIQKKKEAEELCRKYGIS